MTIAITIKIHDGIVVAADSASTLMAMDEHGAQMGVLNVYNHANKISNLVKGRPIGAVTWGSGSIGKASITTLAKDLRRRFTGEVPGPGGEGWALPENYTMAEIASALRRFFYEERYLPIFGEAPKKPSLGFFVVGYSANADTGEVWQVKIDAGQCGDPVCIRGVNDTGINWSGEIEAVTRLIMGHGTALPGVLQGLGVPADQIGDAVTRMREGLQVILALPPMPIQDAIDLAHFLVESTIMFSRFSPGAPTVGGPIEIAAITKHEGFKWVRRKHYYDQSLNPMPEV